MFHLAGGREERFKIVPSRKEQAPPVEELAGPDEKNPGGDLLLRDLSSDYHWRGSVSLPGSERDRVGPLRSGHRASGGRGDFFFILPAREPCFFGGF